MTLTETEKLQIEGIKSKIPSIKSKDPEFKIFGAGKHKYTWSKPATEEQIAAVEKKRGIEIPRALRIFLRYIANGGPGFAYGIYPVERMYTDGDPHKPCILYPYMTQQAWEDLQEEDNDEDNDLISYYNGVLTIATEGCTYDIGIILNGKYKGRLVRTDLNLDDSFLFIHDQDFLSWYERWLDGILNNMDPKTFGSSVPGEMHELINAFYKTDHEELLFDLIISINRFPQAKTNGEAIKLYKHIAENNYNARLKKLALRFMGEIEPEYMFNHVQKLLLSGNFEDNKAGVHVIAYTKYWKKHLETVIQLFQQLDFGNDHDLFRAACSMITEKEYPGEMLEKFLYYPDKYIRSTAIYYIRNASDFDKYIDTLISFFSDPDIDIVRSAIQSAEKAGMNVLYEPYKKLWNTFSSDTEADRMIRSNLKNQLRRAGYHQDSFEKGKLNK